MSFCLGPPGRNGFSQWQGWFQWPQNSRSSRTAACTGSRFRDSWYLLPGEQSHCTDPIRLREFFYPREPDMVVKKDTGKQDFANRRLPDEANL